MNTDDNSCQSELAFAVCTVPVQVLDFTPTAVTFSTTLRITVLLYGHVHPTPPTNWICTAFQIHPAAQSLPV